MGLERNQQDSDSLSAQTKGKRLWPTALQAACRASVITRTMLFVDKWRTEGWWGRIKSSVLMCFTIFS